jgi:hypothetical protein
MDSGDSVLVDDLDAITPHKLDREAVEPSDLILESDPIHKKHRRFRSVIAKMFQERVLEVRGALCGHFLILSKDYCARADCRR